MSRIQIVRPGTTYTIPFLNLWGGMVDSMSDEDIPDNCLSLVDSYMPDRSGTGRLKKRPGLTKSSDAKSAAITSVFDGRNGNYFTTASDIYDLTGTSLSTTPTNGTTPDWCSFATFDCYTDGTHALKTSNGSTFTTLSNIPSGTKYIESHNNFLFAAGHDAGKLRWAELGVAETWPATNEFVITQDENDNIVGIRKFRDALVVMCQKSFHHVSGYSSIEMAIQFSSYEEGCTSHRSIVVTPVGLFWWSKMGLTWSPDGYKIDYPMQRKLAGTFATLVKSQFSVVHGCWDPNERCLIYFVTNTSGSTHNLLIRYYPPMEPATPLDDSFWLATGAGANMSASGTVIASGAATVYVGMYGSSNVYLHSIAGATDDGTNITATLETKREAYNGATSEKRAETAALHTNLGSAATITYGYYLNDDTSLTNSWSQSATTTTDRYDFGVNRVHRKIKHQIADAAATQTKIFGVTHRGYVLTV